MPSFWGCSRQEGVWGILEFRAPTRPAWTRIREAGINFFPGGPAQEAEGEEPPQVQERNSAGLAGQPSGRLWTHTDGPGLEGEGLEMLLG